MTDRMRDQADEWFYDLGKLAQVVENNQAQSEAAQRKAETAQRKAETARKRTLVLTVFVLFAFLLLAWRSEVNGSEIRANADKIVATQQATCVSGLAIVTKFNMQQDQLVAIERTNPFINDEVRNARIKAYEDVRVIPLPICGS